jgi:hypothetical protein
MQHPLITSIGLVVLVSVSLVTPASATISIDYVTVGNIKNAADSTGYGAVNYGYYDAYGAGDLASSYRGGLLPGVEDADFGFRVASSELAAVPEPTSPRALM